MAGSNLLESTIEPPRRGAGSAPLRVPALTILHHPECGRVGQLTRLVELLEGRPVALSRGEPCFAPPGPGSPAGEPLGDRHLSRSAARLVPVGSGVLIEPGGSALRLDGEGLQGPRQVSSEALERGAVLEVADRTVLLLHLATLPAPLHPALGLVGRGAALEALRGQILRVAPLSVPVLIEGETGSGKELVARAIAEAGPRAGRPFVAVNLGAVPAAIATAELLGHTAGAFTGAAGARAGHFVSADGGTLFLDEVGLASAGLQAALLRVLETGEVQPLGSDRSRRVDVRVLSATDEELAAAIAAGSFREALLHRLAGYRLVVPPLRDHREDLGPLLAHFLARELEALGAGGIAAWWPRLPAALVARLARYGWPGNVRQLANVARRLALALQHAQPPEEELVPEWLLPGSGSPAAAPARGASEAQEGRPARIDDQALRLALRATGWRTSAAARALGISRTTLYAMIDASPTLRKAKDLPADELRACHASCGGDLEAMAERLEVSARGLRLRLSELGLD